MIAAIVDGKLTLDGISADEAKLLCEALEHWTLDLLERAASLEIQAGEHMEAVRGRRAGKAQASRIAGQLRQGASAWRAVARDGADLLRTLTVGRDCVEIREKHSSV